MAQFNFHKPSPPQQSTLPVVERLVGAYKLWHEFAPHFPKTSRYTLGGKIDGLFLKIIEAIITASFLTGKDKLLYVGKASKKLDILKFFLQVAWEIKALDNKKYIALSERLFEIGKMLGGWIKHIEKETSAF